MGSGICLCGANWSNPCICFSGQCQDGQAEATAQLCMELPRLKDLLQFICGSPYLPCDGLIKISFTNSTLPDSESCFLTMKLPLLNNDYREFENSMNIAINSQHQGYGRG